jgi:hypothetical protein
MRYLDRVTHVPHPSETDAFVSELREGEPEKSETRFVGTKNLSKTYESSSLRGIQTNNLLSAMLMETLLRYA